MNTTTSIDLEPICPQWDALRPRTKTGDLSAKTSGSAIGRMFDAFGISEVGQSGTLPSDLVVDAPDVCATQLIRYLAHHQFIDSCNDVGQQGAIRSESLVEQIKHETTQPMTPSNSQRSSTLPAAIHRGPRPLSGHRDNVNRRPRHYLK